MTSQKGSSARIAADNEARASNQTTLITCRKFGRKAAIDRKCKKCIYDPKASGNWREQVLNCTSFKCPLFDLRPTPARTTSKPTKLILGAETSGYLPISIGVK